MREDTERRIALQELNPNPLRFVDIRPAPVRGYVRPKINWLRIALKLLRLAVGLSIVVGAAVFALAFIVVNW